MLSIPEVSRAIGHVLGSISLLIRGVSTIITLRFFTEEVKSVIQGQGFLKVAKKGSKE